MNGEEITQMLKESLEREQTMKKCVEKVKQNGMSQRTLLMTNGLLI